jgi:hypothetical protein
VPWRFEVDDELEPGRLYDRKVGGFGPIEDATHIDTHLEHRIGAGRSTANGDKEAAEKEASGKKRSVVKANDSITKGQNR